MIFKPSYTVPYLSAIDETVENTFSCYINAEGGTAINKYSLTIKDLNSNDIYNVEESLSPPLYNGNTLEVVIPNNTNMINGNDYTWNIRLYESQSSMWVTYGVVQSGSTATEVKIRNHYNIKNGMYLKIGSEKRKITSYTQSTGIAIVSPSFTNTPSAGADYTIYTDFIDSDDIYFKARKTPVISITTFDNPIINKKYDFVGNYSQDNGVGWRYFNWILYDENDNIIDTTGEVNYGEISYTFDGFLDNTNYKIQLIIENQDGIITSTDKIEFLVNYDEPSILNRPAAEVLYDKDAIKVRWKQPYVNSYIEPLNYSFIANEPYVTANSLNLQNENQLIYNINTPQGNVLIPYASSTFLQSKFPIGFSGQVIKFEDSTTGDYFDVTYIDGSFIFTINGIFIGSLIVQPPSGTWLLTTIEDFNPGIRYIWIDDAIWSDSIIWEEQTQDILSDNWWKFIFLPDRILLDMIPIHS